MPPLLGPLRTDLTVRGWRWRLKPWETTSRSCTLVFTGGRRKLLVERHAIADTAFQKVRPRRDLWEASVASGKVLLVRIRSEVSIRDGRHATTLSLYDVV